MLKRRCKSVLQKAVFLDRDGTINKEIGYLYRSGDFAFIPGAVEAIKICHSLGYKVIVITNQSGVAQGYYTEEDIQRLHIHIDKLLALEGTHIDAYYYCPHHPEGVIQPYTKKCSCRKPAPAMIEQAVKDFDIDLCRSFCIGDKPIDAQAGMNAGVGRCALVKGIYPIDEKTGALVQIFDNLYKFALHLKVFEGQACYFPSSPLIPQAKGALR